jgi:hypothetical protein
VRERRSVKVTITIEVPEELAEQMTSDIHDTLLDPQPYVTSHALRNATGIELTGPQTFAFIVGQQG